MAIDLTVDNCTSLTDESQFGLCDNGNLTPAFISFNKDIDKWIALINNTERHNITFVAIDNCIDVRGENGDLDNRCDCLLLYHENIVLVELKEKRSDWIQDGIDQVESTIIRIQDNSEFINAKRRRAFISNRKHPHFHVLNAELKQSFFTRYKVRISVDATINC